MIHTRSPTARWGAGRLQQWLMKLTVLRSASSWNTRSMRRSPSFRIRFFGFLIWWRVTKVLAVKAITVITCSLIALLNLLCLKRV